MKAILIDDDSIALNVLRFMLSSYEKIDVVGSYTKPLDALQKADKIQPDVIFLDIEMEKVSGLELARIFMEKFDSVEIVFVTAYSQYAIEAFEINAIDYLLKPIQEKRLSKTIERLREKGREETEANSLNRELKVNSFGIFEVLDSENNPLIWRTQKSKELFAYLWNKKGKAVSKMLIMENVFPSKSLDKGITLLHTTIYQLRKSLEKLGYPNGVIYLNNCYQLNVPIRSDLQELTNILDFKQHSDEEIKAILRIYKRDFLEEECYYWAIELQQRYKERVFNILERYAREQLKYGRLTSLLKTCLDKIYKMDYYNEGVAKMMIHYYGKQGKRSSLENFFNKYAESLWEEIGLHPLKSTIDIYREYM